ncbi:hypothetical protein DRP07_05320 [Archaeoglobales archaeon]|nr:MAG: hypothetical protein DRP07_05320 [Archaeoglobales archaeon]
MVKVKASSKGQIVIPKDIRDKLGIRAGSVFEVTLEGNRIVLEPSAKPPDVFVELGEESEKILEELRRDEERIKRLLRDLGVE